MLMGYSFLTIKLFADVAMFIGALLIGYFTYMLQHGFKLSFFSFMVRTQISLFQLELEHLTKL